jgi:hypothetical protein
MRAQAGQHSAGRGLDVGGEGHHRELVQWHAHLECRGLGPGQGTANKRQSSVRQAVTDLSA